MSLVVNVIQNRYIDSVSLMALSTKANQIEGVKQVIVAMATDMNKEVMKNVGLYNTTVEELDLSKINTKNIDDATADLLIDLYSIKKQ